jgi:hypothetical protein
MRFETVNAPDREPVIQFSIFADNCIGRLNDILVLLGKTDVNLMAISTYDHTEIAMMRVVVNYPEEARKTLSRMGVFFEEHEVLAIELNTEADLKKVTSAITGAEINIYYIYPMLMRPNNKMGIIISTEDSILSQQVIECQGLKVLDQKDLGR